MLNDNFKVKGKLDIVLTGSDGDIKEYVTIPNLVVNTGKNYITHRMVSNSNVFMSHMALGNTTSGTGSEGLGNTTLQSEILATFTGRKALTGNTISGTGGNSGNVITYTAGWLAGEASFSITEAGIFNSGTINAGEMLCRTTFAAVNKGASDTLNVTWTVSTT
jgi:hypothetical protein